MSWAVGSFELLRIALFLRPIWRGRVTEGEVGEAALFLLSLDDCVLPMVCVSAAECSSYLVPWSAAAFTLRLRQCAAVVFCG
jgi:hypothetical protein